MTVRIIYVQPVYITVRHVPMLQPVRHAQQPASGPSTQLTYVSAKTAISTTESNSVSLVATNAQLVVCQQPTVRAAT